MDIYGFKASEGFISDVTGKLLPQIGEWQNRPLDDVYPVLFIDAIHYSVRDNGVIRKLATYVILGISLEGKKEVLTIEVGKNESAKYWLSVLNGLKNRSVRDILVICADGLTGIKEAINTAFPPDRMSTMHRTSGAQYPEIRVRQGQEGIYRGSQENISCAECGPGSRDPRPCYRKMV